MITLLGGAAVACPFAVRGKVLTAFGGSLFWSVRRRPTRCVATFGKRMQELGWIEGQTVRFEFRRDAGDTEQIARHAAELLAARPDEMAISSPVVAALKR